jgi:hypothetical protein
VTVTGVVSLAKPVKEGVVLLLSGAGWWRLTVGGFVFTVNDTVLLCPVPLPSELSCAATAVYSPLSSAGLASPELQPPPVPDAVAVDTAVPSALLPL